MPIEKDLVEEVSRILEREAPDLVSEGLYSISEKSDDPLLSTVFRIFAESIEKNGVTIIEGVSAQIVSVIEGDALTIAELKASGASAESLSQLAIQLQDEEQAEKQKAKAAARVISSIGQTVFTFLGDVAIHNIKKRI